MNRLEYHFDCLDGRCLFICKFDEGSLNYDLESTIAEIPASFGELSRDDSELFNKYIAQANIPGWEKEYEPVLSKIEDGIKWKVKLNLDGKEYVSKGEESYEPYGYVDFIKAMKLCVPKAGYFMAESE